MAEASVSVKVDISNLDQTVRVIKAAAAHVARSREKHGLTSPDECFEPTMAELWRSLEALQQWMDS